MCGISGFWAQNRPQGLENARNILLAMNAQIHHRGPDEDGIYVDETTTLGLSHKRLSIVDLTPAGAQPMFTKSGRYVIVYNGELYNTDEIRQSLASRNIQFRGHSDTEVLIEAIEAYGIEETLKKLNGMFALALFDIHQKTLYLARDHVGIKPLFWSFQNGVLLFGSELKPMISNPLWKGQIDLSALNNFFLFNYIPGPQSIYQNTHKLLPGHYIVLKDGGQPDVRQYWSAGEKVFQSGVPFTKENYIENFEELLSDSIRRQMVSDVPLGVFLSGGIDSSLVAALMQKNSGKPIKTFTIGFEEDAFDESQYARKVAAHIGSEHHEEILSVKRAQDIVTSLPDFYDEPFADSSQLPTMLLCQFARQHVTVSLSGDGGDELFLGYSRYFYGDKLFRLFDKLKHVPMMRHMLNAAARSSFANQRFLPQNFDFKLRKMAHLWEQKDTGSRYQELISLWSGQESPLLKSHLSENLREDAYHGTAPDNLSRMREHDINAYLPDDILQKTDRASMAYSLEARVPLLDIRVFQNALDIPAQWHVADGRGKYVLRSILAKHVPRPLFERPKHGFSVPIGEWLRKDMRDLAESYLSRAALNECGYIDADMITKRWKQHLAGTHNWQHSLWGVLMFQMWRAKYKI